MIKKPQLINSKFTSFQRNSKIFSGKNYNNNILKPNTFFLRSIQNFYIKTKHLDMLIWYSKWKLKKKGWIIFPISCDYPLTKKPTEVRMGKGKGAIYDWSIPLKKGSNFLYINSQNKIFGKVVLKELQKKLPIKSKISIFNQNFLELTPSTMLELNNKFLKKL